MKNDAQQEHADAEEDRHEDRSDPAEVPEIQQSPYKL
jgi:hypothetical protein